MYHDETAVLRASANHSTTILDHSQQDLSRSTYASYSRHERPPTPPPDMHKLDDTGRSGAYPYELPAFEAATQSLTQSSVGSLQELGRNGTISQPLSPSTFAPSFTTNQETTSQPSVSRRGSQASAIAPSFQIPKTVNDSGGSLSELAAQITCLFWFESSELLQQIEQAPHAIIPSRPLVKDAVPLIGFRKWVTTILSTTLVGANVVLLALLFIHRLKIQNPAVKGKPGSEYRLLTVALMLGNKFLDDNTYTNKTWAEVSGINVSEVHIMEVEFLSNMKYNLYTSMEDWTEWQTLLGRYAQYVDKAMHPLPLRATTAAPLMPLASSIRMPITLPSPPSSTQASPPYDISERAGAVYAPNAPVGLTPAPSPLALYTANSQDSAPRKRSRDDSVVEPPAKRLAHTMYRSADHTSSLQPQRMPTLPPPLPLAQVSQSNPAQPMTLAAQSQLAPISVPQRAMGLVYPNTSQSTPTAGSVVADLRSGPFPQSQASSRQQSPFWRPGDELSRLPPSSTLMHPLESSPSAYLQQRSSPYRPVHNVSTLLYPPPSAALQPRQQHIEHSQMQYQPLGKAPQIHAGRLPVFPHLDWLDALKPLPFPNMAPSRYSQQY